MCKCFVNYICKLYSQPRDGCISEDIVELKITSCSASMWVTDTYHCKRTYDGNIHWPGWATKQDRNGGAWIKINFAGIYRLTNVMTMNRDTPYPWDINFKDTVLEFSDGNKVNFTLTNTKDRVWDTIDLVGNGDVIISSYVKITALSVYGEPDGYTGFAELKVFGCSLGMVNEIRNFQ